MNKFIGIDYCEVFVILVVGIVLVIVGYVVFIINDGLVFVD